MFLMEISLTRLAIQLRVQVYLVQQGEVFVICLANGQHRLSATTHLSRRSRPAPQSMPSYICRGNSESVHMCQQTPLYHEEGRCVD